MKTHSPCFVARDRDARMTVGYLVQNKGTVSDHTVKRLAALLREIGHHDNKIIIKLDRECVIKAVADKLVKERGEAQTIAEHSPAKSPGSSGLMERAVQEVERQLKTMKLHGREVHQRRGGLEDTNVDDRVRQRVNQQAPRGQ